MLKHIKISFKDILLLFLCIGITYFQVKTELSILRYMSDITTLVQTPTTSVYEITNCGKEMLCCAILALFFAITHVFLASILASRLGYQLRSIVFQKVLTFNSEEINKFSTASLITRSVHDVDNIQMMIAIALQTGVKTPILFISVLSEIKNKAWQWSIVPIFALIIIVIVATIVMKLAIPKFKKIQTLLDNINRVTREQLNGIRVVRAYNAEDYQIEKFENLNEEIMRINLFANRVMSIMRPLISTIMSAISLIVYWIGAYLIVHAVIDVRLELFSDMIVYASYAIQIMSAIMTVLSIIIMFPRYKIHLERVNELLNTEIKIKNGTRTDLEKIHSIQFKNVSFQYPDGTQNVLNDVSFEINEGETVAIIGTTASGKTSIINLLLRLFDVTSGQILINNIDIRSWNKEVLNAQIGYVPQKTVLFSGNIAQNVAYGDDNINVDLLWKALNISQSNSFVESLLEQELSSVAQNGTNFSGGQRQRLSIARAIYKKASLFIFDDSFSALDYKTDKVIRDALSEEIQEAIKIIVAQRIGTIKNADKILVLDNGKLVGFGIHQELLRNCETYKEIALSQLTEDELYG